MTKQPRRRALLIVDVQNGFCPGGNLPVAGGDEIVPVINAMTGSGYYDVVVASQDWHPAGHGSFASAHGASVFELGKLNGKPQMMWPDHCVRGTADADFHPLLDMTKVDFVQRKGQDPSVDSYSAFRDNDENTTTGLDIWLSQRGVYLLDVCGLATDYCVKFSALDASRMLLGHVDVRFVEDASRGISADGVADAKKEMKKAGIEVIDSSAVLAPFAYRAEHGFGSSFHTALRKGADTKWSVVLWNYLNQIIRLDEDEQKRDRVWPSFVDHCTRFWIQGAKPSEAARKWAAMFEDFDALASRTLPMGGVASALKAMIELCDQQTWDEIDATVGYWVDETEADRLKEVAAKREL